MFKAPNSFITAKGSMPIQFKITSSKCKADNQGELHVIKKLKMLHNSNNNTSKQKMKINLMHQEKNKNSHHLMKMKMIHHQAANNMEKITVVHMMPYLQFCSIYGCQSLKSGKKEFKDSNQYLSTLHGFQKYLRGVSTLGVAHDDVQTLLNDKDPVLFPSGHNGCSVSALATTDVLSCI